MTTKQTNKQGESDSKKHQVMPSEKVLLELFRAFVHEYSSKRNLVGIRNFLSLEATAIGSQAGEFWINPDDLLASLETDIEQIPREMEVFNDSFRVERLNDACAIIWGRFGIRGKTADGKAFENPDCQITAVYCLKNGKPLICHIHGSQIQQQKPAVSHEPWPLHRLSAGHHETAELYRLLFDNSPVGILHYDCNGMLKDCNQKFLKIVGSTFQKVSGMNLLNLPDKQAVECIGNSLKGRIGHYEGFYSSVTVNKFTPIRVIAAPIFAIDSTISGGIAIFEDISEHRATEDRLQYQFQFERLISSIAQSLVSAQLDKIDQIIEDALGLSARFFDAERGYVFQIDFTGETITNTHEWCATSVNSLMPKYQQYPLNQLTVVNAFDRHVIEYLHFPDVKTIPEEMSDFKKLLIDDGVKSILLLPMLVQGKFVGLFGYDCVKTHRSWAFEEITLLKVIGEMFSNALAKKASEKQIHDSEEKYRLVAENVSDVIWIIDLETFKYTYISPSVTRMLGYTTNEMMLSEVTATLTDKSAENLFQSIPERLNNLRANQKTRYVDEVELVCKDGRVIEAELTGNWIFNPVTQHAEVIGITRDITERKTMEEQKRQFEIHRQQSLKADSLGRMAGAIAHHFNNQLQVILGNLELLALDKQKTETTYKNVNDAMRATHKAAEMSTMMLTYLGQHNSKDQIVNINELCSSQLEALQKELPSSHILELTESEAAAKVSINREHLVQILRNVVTNASEACKKNNNNISLVITHVLQNEIPVNNRFPLNWVPECDCYVCLRVQDQGVGIPEEDIYKTFDPFFTTKGPGRGLGLANTLGFMRGAGGGITLSSRLNHGSTFCLYFPCVEGSAEEAMPLDKILDRQPAGEMILVIEDEEMVRFITRSLLENFNYRVIEADCGAKGIEILNALRGQIDLVICDLVMPGIDGWQTLEGLRKIEPDIPVILASGYDQSFVMRGEHNHQPQAYLSKPYNSTNLQQAIMQALSQHQPQ